MTRKDLIAVMEKHPDLLYAGFYVFRGTSYYNRMGKSWADVMAEKDKDRQELKDSDLELLSAIEAIFAPVKKIGSINPHSYSYHLKHVAEDLIGNYVCNGQLIAVMLHLGFRHTKDALNASFNASERDLKEIRKRREEVERRRNMAFQHQEAVNAD